jgi:PHD/YefM family antitoxin component YafN of YafNO toxin-antitoxin module
MSEAAYPTLDVTHARRELARIYEQVTRDRRRIELRRRGSEESCILISKAELDGLERALAILSDGDDVKRLCETLAHVASIAHQQYCEA